MPIKDLIKRRLYKARYRVAHADKFRIWHAESRARIGRAEESRLRAIRCQEARAFALKVYGSMCECCGENREVFLAFDHVNGGGTKHRKEFGHGLKFYRWLVATGIRREGFRILCHNCNFAWHFRGGCPHKV